MAMGAIGADKDGGRFLEVVQHKKKSITQSIQRFFCAKLVASGGRVVIPCRVKRERGGK